MLEIGCREVFGDIEVIPGGGNSELGCRCVCTRYLTCSNILTFFKSLPEGPQSDDLLRPVFMGCATKNAKVVAISLGSLQRLIALKAVPQSAVPLIINTMSDAVSQGVDIQLRILQTLLSLITNFPAVHGALLGDVRARAPFDTFCFMLTWQLPTTRLCCFVSNCKNHVLQSYLQQQLPLSDNL